MFTVYEMSWIMIGRKYKRVRLQLVEATEVQTDKMIYNRDKRIIRVIKTEERTINVYRKTSAGVKLVDEIRERLKAEAHSLNVQSEHRGNSLASL